MSVVNDFYWQNLVKLPRICKKIETKILPIVLYGGLVTAKLQEEKDENNQNIQKTKSSTGSVFLVWCVTYHKK